MTDTSPTFFPSALVDPILPEAQALAAQWMVQCQQAATNCWVQLDRGFLHASAWSDLEKTYAPIAVYTGRLADAEQVAPHLIAVPDALTELEMSRWLAGLYACSQGRPMLSYLCTPADFDAAAWLQARSHITVLESNEHFIARLADTRCLPQLVAVLTAQQQHAFFAGVQDWRYHDRQGQLCSAMPAGVSGDELHSSWKPVLSHQQQQDLTAMALPDTVFSYLRQKPEIFGRFDDAPSAIYACINQALQTAGENPNTVIHEQLQLVLQTLKEKKFLVSENI